MEKNKQYISDEVKSFILLKYLWLYCKWYVKKYSCLYVKEGKKMSKGSEFSYIREFHTSFKILSYSSKLDSNIGLHFIDVITAIRMQNRYSELFIMLWVAAAKHYIG